MPWARQDFARFQIQKIWRCSGFQNKNKVDWNLFIDEKFWNINEVNDLNWSNFVVLRFFSSAIDLDETMVFTSCKQILRESTSICQSNSIAMLVNRSRRPSVVRIKWIRNGCHFKYSIHMQSILIKFICRALRKDKFFSFRIALSAWNKSSSN